MQNLIFKKATKKNSKDILSLYKSLIATSGCTWNDEYPSMHEITEDTDNNSLYVLEDNNENLVAVAFGGKCDELDHLSWDKNIKNFADLARIGVSKDYQNKGIASLMITKITYDLKERGFDGVRLLVGKSHPHAIRLYEKNGFSRAGEAFIYDIDFYMYEKNI